MKTEDFTIRRDQKGKFSEGTTKTRQNELYEKYRLTLPKMFETNSDHFPVTFLKFSR